MPRMNVSFQGGGSYLAVMVPIAHALSDARRDGHLELEGVAGSSAGSVVAALLAGGADFQALRTYCHGKLAKSAKRAAGPFFDRIGPADKALALARIIRGKDLVSGESLKSFFTELFEAAKIDLTVQEDAKTRPLDLRDFGIGRTPRLIVTRSGMEHERLDMPVEGPLMDTLVDSCAIPFLLRNYRFANDRAFVDGGLCENLPITGFDLEGTSAVLAVSVEGPPRTKTSFNLMSFALGLFSTAIGHNVARSKSIVGKLMTIEEQAAFQFHEVSAAVQWIANDAEYDRVYQKTRRKLLDLASYYTQQGGDGIFSSSRDTKAARDLQLREMLRALHDPERFQAEKVELRVNAESLQNPDHNSYRRMDIVTSCAHVRVRNGVSNFYKSYIPLLDGGFHPVTWHVVNVTRGETRVRFTPFHYHDEFDGGDVYDPCFIRFDHVEEDLSEGDMLKVQCVYAVPSAMTGLAERGGSEFLSIQNGHRMALPLEIVLIYPSYLGQLRLESREKDGETCAFEVLDARELRSRLGRDAISLAIVGVRSAAPVPSHGWLSIRVVRAA